MALLPKYILILFFLIGVDYFAGLYMEKCARPFHRKLFLLFSIAANIGVLFVFKYFNFFATQINEALTLLHLSTQLPLLTWLLPVGLSFHTFQSLSYVIEVYRGKQKAEKDLLVYSLYVLFWPQLVAGPIERPQNLLYQFHLPHPFRSEQFVGGARLILLGFIKKMVIADRLASYVNAVYNNPTQFSGWPLILATYFFSIQIYCDFSGYTDIARGCANILGFNLSKNFDSPYLARSISEFWKRWHISLSSWFRDYVYIPLGGDRVSHQRHVLNLVIVFLLSGIWHGANWTFVVWGALHSLYLIASKPFSSSSPKNRTQEFFQTVFVFHLVTFAWIFFRANSVCDAFYIVSHLFQPTTSLPIGDVSLSLRQLCVRFGLIFGLLALEAFNRRKALAEVLFAQPTWVRWGTYYFEMGLILSMGVFEKTQFIYFQF